jgi:hypothetical protein
MGRWLLDILDSPEVLTTTLCNAFVPQLGKRERIDEALVVRALMKRTGIREDEITHDAFVQLYCSTGELDRTRWVRFSKRSVCAGCAGSAARIPCGFECGVLFWKLGITL